ncbi:MAG: hypothetical protein EOM46_10365 [Gammaproteobacteria bacterium]|nr:hypothetical protein [Gammaproteobacteria bacterium]
MRKFGMIFMRRIKKGLMPMAGDNDKDKKGFSGLLDLASEVSGIDEPIKPEPKAEAKPPAPKQPSQILQETVFSEQEQKATSSPPSIETVSSGKNDGSSGNAWFLGIIGVVIVILMLINNGNQSNKSSSYDPSSSSQSYSDPQNSPTPAVQTPSTPQSSELQYTKPSVGTTNVLSVPMIRWCIREGIRIETMRNVIDTNAGINEFNRIVYDYNSRCGHYRYSQGSQSEAERDVEPYQSQIVSEAIREARQYQSSNSTVSLGQSTSAPKKPSAQYIRETQQLLTELGYAPGSVDGHYGRRTADAVKAFQRDVGITQNGWIDADLLSALKGVANQRSSLAHPRVESEPKRKSSGVPKNAWAFGSNWYCNDGYRQVGNECVKLKVPANAWVYGSNWYCNDGYRQVGNECVKLKVPTNAWVYGSNWYCNDGYRQVGNECVKLKVPANAWVSGSNWYCNDGYQKIGDKCVLK